LARKKTAKQSRPKEKPVKLSLLLGKSGASVLPKTYQKTLSELTPEQRKMSKWVRMVFRLARQVEEQKREIQQLKRQMRKLMGMVPHSTRPQ
jgi:hypothetical protein